MFVHAVYFWLRNDLSAAQLKQFDAGVHALRAIEFVQAGYIGVPADTNRPIIERGYSRAMVLVFRDEKAHDGYQVHPVHDRFRTECSPLWTKVQIFDSVGQE